VTNKKPDGDVHRLTDIETNEVSIVDRGANKRRLLLRKSEAGAEIVAATDGSLTTNDGWRQAAAKAAGELLTKANGLLDSCADGAREELHKTFGDLAAAFQHAANELGDEDGAGTEDPVADETTVDKIHWMTSMGDLVQQVDQLIQEAKRKDSTTARPNVGSGVQPAPPPKSTAADTLFADMPEMAKMTATMEKLSKAVSCVRTDVRKSNSKLRDLRNGVSLPASVPSEGVVVAKQDVEVAWPMDMNRASRTR